MLSIVIPAHNEEHRIGPVLRALRAEFPREEIIVVANACTDGTACVVSEIAKTDPLLRLVSVNARLGKGGSVRLGFQLAHGEVVAFADADGATPARELRRLVAKLDGADCVVASRWSPGASILRAQSPLRRFLGRGFNFIVRLLFGLHLADTQCGAKVFRRAAIEEIMEDVETADFAFDVDLLFQLQRRKKRIREVPTVWRNQEGSTVDVMVAAPRMLASIVRLRLNHSPARYAIPFFDRLFGISAIKCRRLLHILIISGGGPQKLKTGTLEARFHELVSGFGSDRRRIEWWSPAPGRSVAMEYLRRHRSRFDCVVEVSPNGARFWTPFYSLKPVLMLAPHRDALAWPYADAELLRSVPEDAAALDAAILRAITRRDAYFLLEADGSWSFHPRRSDTAVTTQRAVVSAPAPGNATAPVTLP